MRCCVMEGQRVYVSTLALCRMVLLGAGVCNAAGPWYATGRHLRVRSRQLEGHVQRRGRGETLTRVVADLRTVVRCRYWVTDQPGTCSEPGEDS